MKPRAKQLQTESETGTCLDLTTVHLRRCVLCKPDSGTLKTTWEQKDGTVCAGKITSLTIWR